MDPEHLFVETLDDLSRRIEPGHPEYDMLMSAALLRKLLLEEQPLPDQVNRAYRLKLRYIVNVREPIWKRAGSPAPEFWSREDGLDPNTALGGVEPLPVTRDQLLAQVVMTYKSHEVTIKDLVVHAAHVRGAVHLGTPHTEKDKALSELATRIELGGYSGATRVLQAISRVVLPGLAPLRAAVKQRG
jgi:hypothetical protein